MMKHDHIFIVLLGVILLWTVQQLRSMSAVYELRQKQSASYPSANDLWKCIVVCVVIISARFIWTRLTHSLSDSLVLQGQWSSRVREIKVYRLSSVTFHGLYFIGVSIYAYFFCLKHSSFLPAELGGTGSTLKFWEDYPFQENEDLIKWYFYINGGYQLSCLLYLFAEPILPDFWESLLKHTCATFLIGFSYVGNYIRVGSIIMLCHDACDILTCGCRSFVDTPFKYVTVSLFVFLVGTWGYLRLYCFPKLCLFPIFKELRGLGTIGDSSYGPATTIDMSPESETPMGPHSETEGWMWFVFILLTLLLLNIYWFFLMVKMFVHFLGSGQTTDIHSQDTEADAAKERVKQRQKSEGELLSKGTPIAARLRTTKEGNNR